MVEIKFPCFCSSDIFDIDVDFDVNAHYPFRDNCYIIESELKNSHSLLFNRKSNRIERRFK